MQDQCEQTIDTTSVSIGPKTMKSAADPFLIDRVVAACRLRGSSCQHKRRLSTYQEDCLDPFGEPKSLGQAFIRYKNRAPPRHSSTTRSPHSGFSTRRCRRWLGPRHLWALRERQPYLLATEVRARQQLALLREVERGAYRLVPYGLPAGSRLETGAIRHNRLAAIADQLCGLGAVLYP